jgi:hypothetical protein
MRTGSRQPADRIDSGVRTGLEIAGSPLALCEPSRRRREGSEGPARERSLVVPCQKDSIR